MRILLALLALVLVSLYDLSRGRAEWSLSALRRRLRETVDLMTD